VDAPPTHAIGQFAPNDIADAASPDAIDWNVHTHDGDLVEAHLSGTDSSIEISFAAPYAGDFFPLWENRGTVAQSISVRIRLAVGDRLVRWY